MQSFIAKRRVSYFIYFCYASFWYKHQSNVGCLKPHSEIYCHLLSQYSLNASESVFIDDMQYNVQGAKSLGFSGIEFKNATQCERELHQLGLSF